MNEEMDTDTSTDMPTEQQDHGLLDTALYREAELIEQYMRFIQQKMRHMVEMDARILPLTSPQLHAMMLLSESSGTGLALKELSEAMGLAHSTVSGIIDRLEYQGLVRRTLDADDRRFTRIQVTDEVTRYMKQTLPLRLLGPIVTALQRASEEERRTILEGLATLRRLFTMVADG